MTFALAAATCSEWCGRYASTGDRAGGVFAGVFLAMVYGAAGLVALFAWMAKRDREENVRWRAHMAGDHSRCSRSWPCDVPPEGGPPWKDGTT